MLDMCTSIASYTGSEVDSKYIIDSMNTASVYLSIIGRLFKCKVISSYMYSTCYTNHTYKQIIYTAGSI